MYKCTLQYHYSIQKIRYTHKQLLKVLLQLNSKASNTFAILCYMKRFLSLFILLLSLGACNSYKHISVTLPDGFVVDARVADTPAKQERGLMYVTNLPENQGMLFIFEQNQELAFWMKNTLIDLDMVFIDEDKTVTSVAAQVPHSYTYTPDDEVAYALGYGAYVVELASKTAQRHQVTPGSKLQFNL